MSTMTAPDQVWSSMPGWGVVADLTPPELIAARRLAVVRRLVFLGVAIATVLLLVGYGYAKLQNHNAASALAQERARSQQLIVEQNKYSDVTRLHGSIDQINSQIAKVMGNDVDFANLLRQLTSALPPGMTINQLAVNLSIGTAANTTNTKNTATLDTSGHPHIGAITLAGTGLRLDDVSSYADKLRAIQGVVEVLPTSNQATATGVQYNLSLSVTDQVLSHRFDATKNGGK